MKASQNMQSISNYSWHLREVDSRDVQTISQKFNLPEITARVLLGRGVKLDNTEYFLKPTLKSLLPNPLHFLDMGKAANRLAEAVKNNEKIAIFGDYDVDGATSSALLKRYLRAIGNSPIIYIPDRIEEGYGPNITAMQELAGQGITLCITVDCGTLSFAPINAAKEAGMDIIVIDHHLGANELPNAYAIVNPNRLDETSEYKYLAAVGVAFMLVIATNSSLKATNFFENKKDPDLLQYLDLVALGTVCDVMPLTGLNRAFVAQGLKILRKRSNLGLSVLSDVAGITNIPGAYHLGFILGPRINAGGRVGKSNLGARLLTTENYEEAYEIANELNKLNEERKAIEQLVLDEAVAQVEQTGADHPILFATGHNWHPGVIGIVASRLKEKFNRPAAVIALENGVGKASARSVSGVDLGAAIISAEANGLLIKGGGHAMAAGFSVEENKIFDLHNYLNNIFAANENIFAGKKLLLDGFLSISAINPILAQSLSSVEPFGPGNAEPVFAINNVFIAKADIVGREHIRCIIGDKNSNGSFIKAMCYRSVSTELGNFLLNPKGREVNLAGKIRLNNWMGNQTAEFVLEDIALL